MKIGKAALGGATTAGDKGYCGSTVVTLDISTATAVLTCVCVFVFPVHSLLCVASGAGHGERQKFRG